MSKALEILQKPHHKSKFNNVTMVVYKEEQIKEVIADIEAMKPNSCDKCKFRHSSSICENGLCYIIENAPFEILFKDYGCNKCEPKGE